MRPAGLFVPAALLMKFPHQVRQYFSWVPTLNRAIREGFQKSCPYILNVIIGGPTIPDVEDMLEDVEVYEIDVEDLQEQIEQLREELEELREELQELKE